MAETALELALEYMMLRRNPVAAVLSLVVLLANPCQPEILFQADFETGDLSQ